ncbi:hypothetical protein L7F22_015996 [Adiantum nelumboides]|nr:hypothetical protein [Adiantum nelumboides]
MYGPLPVYATVANTTKPDARLQTLLGPTRSGCPSSQVLCRSTSTRLWAPMQTTTPLNAILPLQRNSHAGRARSPTFGVEAHEDSDIVKALDFATVTTSDPSSKTRVGAVLVPRRLIDSDCGRRHDFMGRSAGSDGFLVWTHRLKNATVETDFVPAGCANKGSHTCSVLGAGVQWNDAYNTVAAVNRTVVGGISGNGTVGSAGAGLPAGHSILSPAHGLGVDNVLQFRVVLPPAGNRAYAIAAS